MPGEKAIVSCMDAEWTDVPAGYRTEFREDLFGKGSGVPLAVTAASKTAPYSWEITVKNEGDEAATWVNGSPGSDSGIERAPVLAAVVKDDSDDGEAVIHEGHMIEGDTFVSRNIDIAPGEEYTAEFAFSIQLDDPELIICWRK